MRAPRYRFPDQVRSTTRTVASRMVRTGEIARTPEQLDAWISEEPDVKESLEKGGYNTAFTSADLFPLLQVFIVQAGGPGPEPDAPEADAPPRASRRGWLTALVLVAAAVLLFAMIGLLG